DRVRARRPSRGGSEVRLPEAGPPGPLGLRRLLDHAASARDLARVPRRQYRLPDRRVGGADQALRRAEPAGLGVDHGRDPLRGRGAARHARGGGRVPRTGLRRGPPAAPLHRALARRVRRGRARGRVVALDAARVHARRLGPGLHYMVGDLGALPLAPAAFDVVLALDVLEHLDDDATALAEAARLLKPGATLVVTVPALPSLWGAQDVVSHHRRRYTKRTLRALFARAGLPAPELTYFNT